MSAHTAGPWSLNTVPTTVGSCHKIGPFPRGLSGETWACVYADGCRIGVDDNTPNAVELHANARLIAAAPDLLAALSWFVMLQRAGGEDSNDCFERVGDVFHRDTGYLRPGKDCRLHSGEERTEAWDKWLQQHINAARAAIASATGEKA